MFKDYANVHKVLDGEVGDALIQALVKKSGIRILGFADGNFRLMYLKEPIKSVEGLNGFKDTRT